MEKAHLARRPLFEQRGIVGQQTEERGSMSAEIGNHLVDGNLPEASSELPELQYVVGIKHR